MNRSRFLWKLYAGYALLILLTVSTVGILVGRQIEANSLNEIERSLGAKARFLEDLYLTELKSPGFDRKLQKRVESLGSDLSTRLTLIRKDGVVAADSDENPLVMDNHAARPEVLQASREGYGTAKRFSTTVGFEMMYVAIPAQTKEGVFRGYVRAALPLTEVDQRLSELRQIVIVSAAVAGLVALAVGFFLARRVTQPLGAMTRVAGAFAAGNYEQRAPINSDDEIGQLGVAFNSMAERLHGRMTSIAKVKNELLNIFESMVEGVIAVDLSLRIVQLNGAARRFLGLRSDNMVGRHIADMNLLEEVSSSLKGAIESGSSIDREIKIRVDDRALTLTTHAAPQRDPLGALVGAVLVLHDISAIRHLETVRRDFFANVSHELKTPITAVRGYVETLLDDPTMPETTHRRFLARIQNQSVRLSALVTDFLSLSRLESGELGLDPKTLDLRSLVRNVAQTLRPVAEDKGIELRVSVPKEPVTVLGDGENLRQSIGNLVDNAIKYTLDGGHVWLSLQASSQKAVVEVADTGLGIAAEETDRIFERFYRVDKARSREMGGTGLGLAIVKHVTQAHGGQVSVESEPGRGSIFRLELPLLNSSTEKGPVRPDVIEENALAPISRTG